LLWEGTMVEVLMAVVTAIIAIYSLSVVFEGFCLTFLKWPERPIWLVGGILLFFPSTEFIVPGLLLITFGFSIQWLKRKKKKVQGDRTMKERAKC